MLGLIELLLRLTWKVLVTAFIFSLFIGLIKSGTGNIRNIRDTLVMAINIGIKRLQGWLFEKYKRS